MEEIGMSGILAISHSLFIRMCVCYVFGDFYMTFQDEIKVFKELTIVCWRRFVNAVILGDEGFRLHD